jgi:quinol monooxygenase YgiN
LPNKFGQTRGLADWKSAMSIVHVLAIITTKPGQRAAVLALLNANAPAVLAEDGCVAYEATIDTENAGSGKAAFGPDTFVVIEKWSNLEALEAHSKAAHMLVFGAAAKDMIDDRMIHVLSRA